MRQKTAVIGAASAVVLAMIVLFTGGAASAIDDIVIPVDTVAFGNEGDLLDLATVTVDPALVGATCVAELQADNNPSVHPDNDLIITTGTFSVVVPDIEATPGEVTTVAGELVLGETIVIQLRFGPDGVTSGGLTVSFDCAAVAPVTTTSAPTTTPAPTTAAPTTTEPPTAVLPATQVAAAVQQQPTFTG